MKKIIVFLVVVLGLASCTSHPQSPLAGNNNGKTLIVTVVDYSRSYANLVTLDSITVQSLFSCVAKTGGSIVHVGVQDNSSNLPVFLSRINKVDTANAAEEKNVYNAAKITQRNKKILASHAVTLEQHVIAYLSETRKFKATQHTDLQHSISLARNTACESIYTQGATPFKRYILILSDMLNDPPNRKRKALQPADYCGATVLIVRPSPAINADSLQSLFINADLHTFTTINDAITFINEQ